MAGETHLGSSAKRDPHHGGAPPCPALLVLLAPPSLGAAVAPALPWVTAFPRAPRLLSARVERPRRASSPGRMQMLNFLQLPKNHQQENMRRSSERRGIPPQRHFPCPRETSATEKGEGAGGDSKGGSSGLSEAPRCAQHRRPPWGSSRAPAAPPRSDGL